MAKLAKRKIQRSRHNQPRLAVLENRSDDMAAFFIEDNIEQDSNEEIA